jgi:hypothetical protein
LGLDEFVTAPPAEQVVSTSTVTPARFLYAFGSLGTTPSQFNESRGLTLTPDDAHLLIADRHNHRVLVFATGADFTGSHAPEPVAIITDGLLEPIAVAVAPAGTVLVADRAHKAVLLYSSFDDNPAVLGRLAESDLVDVADVKVYDDEEEGPLAVVLDMGACKVRFYRLVARGMHPRGSMVRAWGACGAEIGKFIVPTALAITRNRTLVRPRDQIALSYLFPGTCLNNMVFIIKLNYGFV